ncbi:hypothetical protein NUW54_g2380 [Trametes sanguinea]|uniref:Uncharacterized protein n=1 Tax=Trametes sanguinea TaxID=158606 RepID=A0ACC1Q3R0_9APHY|nr:hypothetical protein NUW54_g2380 [Trametes sanguinea]
MPPKTLSTLFLGLELATDQLRASLLDENLELVGVEMVDFDTEIPEYQAASVEVEQDIRVQGVQCTGNCKRWKGKHRAVLQKQVDPRWPGRYPMT